MRAKVERSRAPFDSFERCVLPCLLDLIILSH